MIFLILCILCSAGIMVVFKFAGNQKVNIFSIIVVNYIIAASLGFIIGGAPDRNIISSPWFPWACIIGVLFILMFFVIALSTIKAGISTTTVATKMSVVIPIVFSIVYFTENTSFLKLTGIIIAVLAVFLAVYKKGNISSGQVNTIYLPILLFLGAGLIDSLIKYTQQVHTAGSEPVLFSSIVFSISALCGIIIGLARRRVVPIKEATRIGIFGVFLGIINFGSLYGLVRALDSRVFDSSVIFGINNIGIVLLSVFIAMLFFSEKLTRINKTGVLLSIVAIILLSLVR